MAEVNLEILRDLIQCQESPCASIYMSTEAVHKGEFKKLEIKFKNLLKETAEKLKKCWDFKQRDIDNFLNEAYTLAADNNFWQEQKEGLAVFISPDRFEYFKLLVDSYDKVYLSYNFNLKQLISELNDNQKYYLLSLSPQSNQLYLGERNNLEELELESLPNNIKEFLNLDNEAEEKYQFINTAGGSSVFHGQGAAPDDDNEDLISYLKEIDKVINSELKNTGSYLIAAADDNVFNLYKKISSYDKLLAENISGNAKDMNKNKLTEKSWEIIKPHLHDYLEKDKKRYFELQAGDKTGDQIDNIVEAAHYSKVDVLFLNKKAEKSGIFIEEESRIKEMENDKDYDLYNYAAVQTLLNGGEVYALEKDKMPEKKDILAVYRY